MANTNLLEPQLELHNFVYDFLHASLNLHEASIWGGKGWLCRWVAS